MDSGSSRVDRAYLTSIPGILSMFATLMAFSSMIAVFSGRWPWTHDTPPVVLQEFATTTSFLLLLIFNVVAVLQVYRRFMQGPTFKFVVAGHAAVWGMLTLISSSVLLDHYSSYYDGAPTADSASGVMSLLESFSLWAVVVLLFLDLFGIRRQYIFD